jgi:PAS domain S-box-containing protein
MHGAVSAREQTLPAPQASAEDARLLDAIDAIVWEGDPQTLQFRFVSRPAERVLGHPAEAWLAPGFWAAHVHPDDRDWVIEFCRKASEAGEAHAFEYRMLAADGRVVWLRDVVTVELENGKPVRSRGVMVDVTDRRRAEDARRDAEKRLRAVVSNAPIVLFALDADGIITVCEGKGLEAGRIDPSQFVGRSYRDQEGEIRENLARALAGETFGKRVEFGGRIFDTLYSAVRSDDGGRQGVIGVATDITDRVRAQEESEQLQARMRHRQRLESLGLLAGGIAHDFNNLLASVLGNLDLAMADLDANAPRRVPLERIRDAAGRLSELTKQLLASSGRGTFVFERIDLSALIAGLRPLLSLSLNEKALLRFALADGLPAFEGDPSQVGQALMNLVANASDALGEAGGTISVRTGLIEADRDYLSRSYLCEDCQAGSYVFVEVSDTGAGMDAETIGKAFDPFFTTKFAGRGLGLGVVLGIVRSHRGAICLESEPGRGTTVRILFPRSGSEAGSLRAKQAAQSASAWRGSGRALVIDDEPDVRELTAKMVQRAGLASLEAADGRAALELLRDPACEIDLVLLDLTMPGLGGEETLAEIRRIRPHLPVVLMSGYSKDYGISACAGAISGFLQKPFTRDQLTEALRLALARESEPG